MKNPKFRALLIISGALAVMLFIFGAGLAVGYRKAMFASRFGQDYYREFYGTTTGMLDGAAQPAFLMNMHGIAGVVIDVATATIAVRDLANDEEFVAITPDTVIRAMGNTVPFEDVIVGDRVTVIGHPGADGEVEARFIRLFEGSSSFFAAPPMPMMINRNQ